MSVKCANKVLSNDLKKEMCKKTNKQCDQPYWQLCPNFKSAYPMINTKREGE